jgi:propionate CoA-transferase
MKDLAIGKEVSHPMLSPPPPTKVKRGKILSPEEAIQVIRDGDAIATGGFVGTGFAEEIAIKLEKNFLAIGKPKDLTLIYAAGQEDRGERGLNHLAHEGLLKRVRKEFILCQKENQSMNLKSVTPHRSRKQ